MRKIEIKSWKEEDIEGKIVETNTLKALEILLSNKKPEEIPRGLDGFRFYNRLYKAFDKASNTGILVLEETDYSLLKESIKKEIPNAWGFNPSISEAIDLFLNAKEVEG